PRPLHGTGGGDRTTESGTADQRQLPARHLGAGLHQECDGAGGRDRRGNQRGDRFGRASTSSMRRTPIPDSSISTNLRRIRSTFSLKDGSPATWSTSEK